MSTFKLRVVASNKVFFEGEVQQLVIPVSGDGLKGFLANHENTVAPIEFGEMRITDADGNEKTALVGSGFIEYFDNCANLVCISVEPPEEIDERRAREAKERAEEKLRQRISLREYHQSQADLTRAMERLKASQRSSGQN